jgi:hypothetical protein
MTESYRVCPYRNVPAAFEHFQVRQGTVARARICVARILVWAAGHIARVQQQPVRLGAHA